MGWIEQSQNALIDVGGKLHGVMHRLVTVAEDWQLGRRGLLGQ
jgi:hypothetical protein